MQHRNARSQPTIICAAFSNLGVLGGSYSYARYLVFTPTRPVLVAALRSYSFATRARRVPVPVGARGCAVPLPLRTRSLPLCTPSLPSPGCAPRAGPRAPRAQNPKPSSRRTNAAEKSNKQFGHPAAAFSGVSGVTAGAAAAAAPSSIVPSNETPSARTPARPHSSRDVPARLWRREPPVTTRLPPNSGVCERPARW